MRTALISVPASNVTVPARPLGYVLPAPPSSAAWKKEPLVWTEISPGAPCAIDTDAIVPPLNCTLNVLHAPSLAPITAPVPA